MTGALRVLVLQLRTGWRGLIAWPLGTAALPTASAAGVKGLFPTAADRVSYAATIGESIVTQALNGRAYAVETLGGIAAYEAGFMGQVLFPVAAVAVALRHTRLEEDSGRSELVAAGGVGALAPLAAAVALVGGVAVASLVFTWLGLTVVGLSATGGAWYAASVAATVAFFGAVGLVVAQIARNTRIGWTLGLGTIAACYLLRVLVDGRQWSATWLSPLGWYIEVRPFSDQPRGWPIVACVIWAVVLVAVSVFVRRRRDLGAGVIAPRPGPAGAGARLGTPTGLAWRLNRPAVIGWSVLAAVVAGVFGALADEMADLAASNPTLLEAFGLARGSDLVMRMGVLVAAIAGCAAAVGGMQRLSAEESEDRLGLVLATSTSRRRLWLTWAGVVGGGAAAVVMTGGLVLGVTTTISTGDATAVGRAIGAASGYLVPVLVLAGVAAVLRAARPGAGAVAWALVAWVMIVAFLAESLRLPGWAANLSPVHAVGDLPVDDVVVGTTVGLASVTAVLVVGSVVCFVRRDVGP